MSRAKREFGFRFTYWSKQTLVSPKEIAEMNPTSNIVDQAHERS
eukprot:CAMPEP_0170444904 /NCGR_PEP_ID=MMETSP0117_2-20130122/48778_1 /TAXON_ID=400756 /ORGANISM="Durinskia baltica, Strain CSIRO CS-38" /LENGTH=43 /DNA_ID= /DNA_START= /DNA_END= /DNA_ORIENTATION=